MAGTGKEARASVTLAAKGMPSQTPACFSKATSPSKLSQMTPSHRTLTRKRKSSYRRKSRSKIIRLTQIFRIQAKSPRSEFIIQISPHANRILI